MHLNTEYYELTGINLLLPYIWYYIKPYHLQKQAIKFQDLKKLNFQIEMFSIDSQQKAYLLSQDCRKLFQSTKHIYEKQVNLLNQNNYSGGRYSGNSSFSNDMSQQQFQNYAYAQQTNVQGYAPFSGYTQQPIYTNSGYQNEAINQNWQNQNWQNQNWQNQNWQNQNWQNQGWQNQNWQNQNWQNQNWQNQNWQNPNWQNQGQQKTSQYQGYSDQTQDMQAYQTDVQVNQNTNQSNQNQHRNQHQANQKYVLKESFEQQRAPEKHQSSSTTDTPSAPKIEEIVEKKPQTVKLEKKKFSVDEIRKMIANITNKEDLKKSVDQNLVKEIEDAKNWPKSVETLEVVPQAQKKEYYNKEKKGGKHEHKDHHYDINKGSKYQKSTTLPQAPVQPNFDIRLGTNENLQTAIFKTQLKKQAQGNYADQKAKEEDKLGKVEKVKRQILYDLNRVAPENVKEIFNEMQNYATEDEEICNVLVESIIQKSWQQPKYAASYAKLSSYFGKIDASKFQFGEEKDKKEKKNPFKFILIEKVQHSFDKKQKKESLPEEQDLEKFARETKNLLIGNVKFIAELIKIKLIPKRTIKYCIFQLVSNFLEGYHNFFVKNEKTLNFYEFNFEALIQFLENLGEKYQSIEEKQKDKGQKGQKEDQEEANTNEKASNYKEVEEKLKQICLLQKPYCIIDGYDNLKGNEYFYSFKIISDLALGKVKDGGRIRALLQNLEQRRFSNWKKHHVESQGPKKLKDLKNDEEELTPQQKAKADLALLDDKMGKMLKKYVQNDKKAAFDELSILSKKYKPEQVLGAYLKFVADDKKENITLRMQMYDTIMDKYCTGKSFSKAWKDNFSNIAFLVSEFPYCAAVLAKFVIQNVEKNGGKLVDFFIKYNEDEQEDEFYFMDEVFQKIYHYSKNEQIAKLIEPKKKLLHLLD